MSKEKKYRLFPVPEGESIQTIRGTLLYCSFQKTFHKESNKEIRTAMLILQVESPENNADPIRVFASGTLAENLQIGKIEPPEKLTVKGIPASAFQSTARIENTIIADVIIDTEFIYTQNDFYRREGRNVEGQLLLIQSKEMEFIPKKQTPNTEPNQ